MSAKSIFRMLSLLCILALCMIGSGEYHSARATAPTTLLLNGNNYLQVANDRSLNFVTGMTLEAWVKLTEDISDCMTIVGKNYITSYWLGLCNRTPRFYSGGGGTVFNATAQVPVGQWTHVAATYDGVIRKIYINGLLRGSDSFSYELPGNTDPLQIGADMGAYRFRGMIADVRLWGRAHSQVEIRQDMVRLPDTPQTDLFAAWHLEGGGGEVFNRTNASEVGSPTWNGGAAPPVLYNPILIPRLAAAPTSLAVCNTTDYAGAMRVPIWYWDAHIQPNPVWVNIGATATDIYVCMENVDLYANFTALYLDVDNSGGSLAQSHDFSLRAYNTNTTASNAGDGIGGFTGAPLPGWNAVFNMGEYYSTVGYRVPRSAITSADGQFRMMFIHHWINGISGNDYGWPVDGVWNSPTTWLVFRINDGSVPPADNQNPLVSATHSPSLVVRAGQNLTINANAKDDTDLAQLDFLVDGNVQHTCTYPGPSDLHGSCSHTFIPSVGSHYYYTRVTDQRGRLGYTPLVGFFAQIDGRAPQIRLSHTPRLPMYHQTFTITAVASDPSGITQLTIGFDFPPYSYTCTVSGGSTETCSASISPGAQQIVHYWAWAEDNEHQTVTTNRVSVLLGDFPTSSDPDTDHDGIVNSLEWLLGTDPTNPDTDGDTLLDGWEVTGLQFSDYTFINLPQMGANPLRKDVFVQYDYERGAHVGADAWPTAINLYRRNGINLWVTEIERPRTGVTSTLDAEHAAFQIDGSGKYYFDPRLTWTHHYVYSRHRAGRSWDYLFMTINVNTGDDCPMSSPDPQNDPNCMPHDSHGNHVDRDLLYQTYGVIHELGHDLGLGHGGRAGDNGQTRFGDAIYYNSGGGDWDNINQKPNYLSMMNYHYGYWGGRLCFNAFGDLLAEFDYDQAYLPELDEDSLDEIDPEFSNALAAGYCPAGYSPAITYTCVSPYGIHWMVLTDGNQAISTSCPWCDWNPWHNNQIASGGIDWNCNNTLEMNIHSNINGDSDEDPYGTLPGFELLRSNDDWIGIPYNPGKGCEIMNSANAATFMPSAYIHAIGNPNCQISSSSERRLGLPDDPPAEPVIHVENDLDEPMMPNLEACNGLDDDSDRQIDEGCPDSDSDGIIDALDNCPQTWNPDQADLDGNSLGDACQYPQVSDLTVTSDSVGRSLDWKGTNNDLLGYNIYRQCFSENTMSLLQASVGDFPTTTNIGYKEAIGDRLYCSYCVRAVNLIGQETSSTCVNLYPLFLPTISKH
jgi:hypothetical protein